MVFEKKRATRIALACLILVLFSMVLNHLYAIIPGTGNVTPCIGCSFSVPNGSLTPLNPAILQNYDNGTGTISNNTIGFVVNGIESLEPSSGLIYTVDTTGPITIVYFTGLQPKVICLSCSSLFVVLGPQSGKEVITYAGGVVSEALTVIWSPFTGVSESQKVLFADDFLYPNVLASTQWVIDRYVSQNGDPGIWTSSGFLNFKAQGTAKSFDIHVGNPSSNPSGLVDGTIVKRKLTVAGVQFSYKTSNDANIKAGIAPLFTTGAFPGGAPYGTPNKDDSNSCTDSANTVDNIGIDYMMMDDSGVVSLISCGDGATNRVAFATVDPRAYTVFTVETSAVFCATCTDNQYAGTSWEWGRVYQLDAKGAIIASTDKNVNITASNVVTPLTNTNYVFINFQSGSGSTVTVKVDYVNLQNFGSPVCLNVPGGFLCTRFPLIPKSPFATASLVDTFAWIANFIGGGDPQIGAIFLFFLAILGGVGTIILFTRSILLSSEMAMLILGFFTYAGFLPSWVLFPVILFAAVLVVMIVQKMMGGGGLNGGGGSEE